MSSNESYEVQSADPTLPVVESLLQQMELRAPSDQLDVAIVGLGEADGSSKGSLSGDQRFGWPAILATAVAAMLAGVWLGSLFLPLSEGLSDSTLAVGEPIDSKAVRLTPVSFNVEAFNLLHGHSQSPEYENCGLCHKAAAVKAGAIGDVFEGWFYGDEHFFEVHRDGVDDCSKCHVAAGEPGGIESDSWKGLAKLASCSNCHLVDADGFSGFKSDWRMAGSGSEG